VVVLAYIPTINTEQKEQNWRYHKTQLQTILQSHSNKKHGTGTKTDMKTSGTEYRTQI
jgi:hypothetical protein